MHRFLLILFFFVNINLPGQTDSNIVETRVASYYSGKFEGRKCSSGEIFRQDKYTAAHKTIKFGTRVKVTNLLNDSAVIVKINDRMPRNSTRSIDLSLNAAKKLNFVRRGLVKVKIEILKDSLP